MLLVFAGEMAKKFGICQSHKVVFFSGMLSKLVRHSRFCKALFKKKGIQTGLGVLQPGAPVCGGIEAEAGLIVESQVVKGRFVAVFRHVLNPLMGAFFI